MSRTHKLYRHSVATGKCEDCGLIDNHSNVCHDAAPIRKIEALYDELDNLNLQIRELAEAKGNLLDFVGSVRLWAVGQPTGKSIQESCTKMLEHYAQKRNDEKECPGCHIKVALGGGLWLSHMEMCTKLEKTPQIALAIAAKRRPCWNCKPVHSDPPRECGCVCHT